MKPSPVRMKVPMIAMVDQSRIETRPCLRDANYTILHHCESALYREALSCRKNRLPPRVSQ